ncbi:hypothetical protein JVT61DRAFT_8226 [Boletus reticuloceps]|uniref:Uncharacterized protein n=1 Tax=Boletus reticuloceps TaxID=495285 RepID=A0A8I2YVB7_9AGAM|nr:hypothetical protein JVT61DRAFT_8226 [Boletus reticuloceps]
MSRLQLVSDAIQSFAIRAVPVLDTAPSDNKEHLPGLRFLRDEVRHDCEHNANAPYLTAVWDELVHARHPVAIYRMFSPEKASRAVKVDVVAEHGARWVRVNTIKNARLMMEFREIESYLTSDEDEDEERPRLAQTEFDNSVTIRLTRLDPLQGVTPDPRIGKTIQCLRDMGIDVQLGERSYHPAPIPKTRKLLQPTTNINLDLSALIALISDISHSPLPITQEEAHARFEPPQSYLDWKKDRVKSLARQNQLYNMDGEGDEVTWENSGQQSRALAAQAIQEMNKGTLQEIHERISTHPLTGVTFWTTSEARHRCLQIVSKIGGEKERQRADALLGSTLCTRASPAYPPANIVTKIGGMEEKAAADAYWEHSRYPVGFLPLVPVHVYPLVLPAVVLPAIEDEDSRTAFFDALARTCTGILSREGNPVSQVSAPSDTLALTTPEEILAPAAQTSLPKLTVHTVTSMLAGASRGYTTLTTNRSSVKAMLKAMRSVWGGEYEPEMGAALWMLDPRSLSEGMRSD